MRNVNGQNVCSKCNANTTDTLSTDKPRTTKLLTSGEVEMLEFLNDLDRPDLVNSLKLIHDCAIYHSFVSLDTEEKTALYDIRILWEKMAGMKA